VSQFAPQTPLEMSHLPLQTLTHYIKNSGLTDRILDENQLERLVEGSSQRRYGLVNRALKSGEFLRVRRGLYVLADEWRRTPAHPYALAQRMEPGSYISLESALSWHRWVPEATRTVTSIVPGRKRKEHQVERFGLFTYRPLPVQPGGFLEQVQRVSSDGQAFLLARPLRALMDLVCLSKIEWKGMGWIEQGLRVDRDMFNDVTGADLRALSAVYKNQRVRDFLQELQRALQLEPGDE
jgi:hypothetical protein